MRLHAFLPLLLVAALPASAEELKLDACRVPGARKALCGTLTVPEDRAAPGGRTIDLNIVVLPARADDPARLTRIVEVVSANAPVEGAVVEAWGLPGGPVRKRTGKDGVARFETMPRKGVVYVARKSGFACGWHEPGRWWWTMPEEDDDPTGGS